MPAEPKNVFEKIIRAKPKKTPERILSASTRFRFPSTRGIRAKSNDLFGKNTSNFQI
jgi:hypothetical protein